MTLTDAQLGGLRFIRFGGITNWAPARIHASTLAALERRKLIIGEATGDTAVTRPGHIVNEVAYRLTDAGRDALTIARGATWGAN